MGEKSSPRRFCVSPHQSLSDLPPYAIPSDGLLRNVPLSLLPYAELARVDKPGVALLWFVHVFGILHAGTLLRTPLPDVLYTIAFFFPACEVLMCANFAWNDICDVEFDGRVARTRHRPLVRNALSLPAALIFTCALAMALASFLLPLPQLCTIYATPMALGCLIYPLSKRWTNFPQIFLGMVVASGVFMGAAAVGASPVPYPPSLLNVLNLDSWITTPQTDHTFAFLCSYLTSVCWVSLCETVYSFQDARWDENAGIGTITRLLKGRRTAKTFLCILATAQVILQDQTGRWTQAHSAFWSMSMVATFTALMLQIFRVCLEEEGSCMFWFAAGNMLSGLTMLIGYAGEYYVQVIK